ncbi:MAG: YHYH protein [Ferruginibacter sp.]
MKLSIPFKTTWLAALFLISCLVSPAHPGGHYHKNDGTVFTTWQLKDGSIVKGNFSMGNGNELILEQEEGRLIKIPIPALSDQDQKLARYKIRKFERINSLSDPPGNLPFSQKPLFRTGRLVVSLLFLFLLFVLLKAFVYVWKRPLQLYTKMASLSSLSLFMMAALLACKKTAETITTSTAIPKTSTGFLDSAFAPYKPAVSTRWDNTYYYVADNGFPAHNMMVGITSWQQQVPALQNYTGSNSWSIPLQPVYADIPVSTKTNFMKGAVAIAVNGIPIFNALNNRGEDAYLFGELDNWGGHCGRADDYHYHIAPLHLATGTGLLPVAFALDGFAVYGPLEPDGSPMQPLDTCHGHAGINGTYHYHGTSTYPYVIGAMKGKVSIDPATAAPENQILPQAFASPFRPPGTPLSGASITAFDPLGPNRYLLTYKRGTKYGSVNYSWDASNKYTFVFTDTAGIVTTAVYQR